MKSLNDLRKFREFLLEMRRRWLVRRGIDLHPTCGLSLSARIQSAAPGSI